MAQAGAYPRLRLTVAGVWTVSLWTVGIAAATLSAVLTDRHQFGQIVSALFQHQGWIGLVCGLAMLALTARDHSMDAKRRRSVLILTVLMLACVGVYFGLQPFMASLRETAGQGGVMTSDVRKQFMLLHAGSMLAHVVQAILGIVLVLKSLPHQAQSE